MSSYHRPKSRRCHAPKGFAYVPRAALVALRAAGWKVTVVSRKRGAR